MCPLLLVLPLLPERSRGDGADGGDDDDDDDAA